MTCASASVRVAEKDASEARLRGGWRTISDKFSELADELTEDAGTAVDVKTQELMRILNRWQFTALFTAKNSFSYLQSGDPAKGLPDNGRSLWTLENNHIRFEAQPDKGVLGIIETVREPAHFIIRMQISAQTTSAMLILGASRDQNLDAHVITLDASAFGQIVTLPVVKTLVTGNAITSPQSAGWNDVEISVDGQKVSIQLNGQSGSTSQLKDLRPGRLGIARVAGPHNAAAKTRHSPCPHPAAPGMKPAYFQTSPAGQLNWCVPVVFYSLCFTRSVQLRSDVYGIQ